VIYDGDARHLVRTTGNLLRGGSFSHHFLFMALGSDPDPGLREGVEALADTVVSVGTMGLDFEYRYLPGEDHYSIGHKAFFDGLRWVFRDWARIPDEVLDGGLEAVNAYVGRMEGRFGYPIGAHWGGPYARGFDRLGAGDSSGAAEMFLICTELAEVPACYSGLGRVDEEEGRLASAREYYERALELAREQEYADLDAFQDAIDRVSRGPG
jgi:tetratricopeptide (TPR) repeat protein